MSSPETTPEETPTEPVPSESLTDPGPSESPAEEAPAPTLPAPKPGGESTGLGGQVVIALILLLGVGVFIYKQSQSGALATPTPAGAHSGEGAFQLGLQLQVKEDHLVVREALEGGAGAKAGILTGDRILAIGDTKIPLEGDSVARSAPVLAALSALRPGDVVRLTLQRKIAEGAAPSPLPTQPPGATPAPVPEEGYGAPFMVHVAFTISEGKGFEAGLGKTLIAKGVNQLLSVRRADGWWPHYVVPEDPAQEVPSVAVSALVAYALQRASPQLDEAGVSTLKQVRDQLARAQGEDGGIRDPAQRRQHRVYATSLALQALLTPEGKPVQRHAAAVERMRDWLVAQQVSEQRGYDPIDRRYGGWSYHDSFASSGLRTDVSTARYALQALAKGGLPPDDPAWRRAGFFLEVTQNHATFSRPEASYYSAERRLRDGGFSFRPRGSKAGMAELGGALLVGRSYGTATADGLLGLLSLNGVDYRRDGTPAPHSEARVLAALSWLSNNYQLGKTPGFGGDPDGWADGLLHYYLAALCESLHRAGVWKIEGPDRQMHLWSEELIRILGFRHGKSGGRFTSASRLMHEDAPAIAPSFAVIALAAARDRLELAGGLEVKRADPPAGVDLFAPDPVLPAPDAVGRGRTILQSQRCMSCHSRANQNGPALEGVGTAYLIRYGASAAATLDSFLADPFKRKGILGWGDDHGNRRMTIQVKSEAERSDLVSYLLAR